MKNPQLKGANFRGKNGGIYLVRCYVCGGKHGRENYAPAVSSGVCVWCGYDANLFDNFQEVVKDGEKAEKNKR